MNQHVSRFATRLSLVSVVAFAGIGAVACSTAATSPPTPTAEAQATSARASHSPGHRVFRTIEALDLRDEQRAAVADIEETLKVELAPHKETLRQIAQTLAAGVEEGSLDAREATLQQAALEGAVIDARLSVTAAVNAVHDVLDAPQREALVAKLKALHDGHRDRGMNEGEAEAPLAKIKASIGLNDEQKHALRDAFRSGVEEIFPDRKAKREAQEAKVEAFAAAFITDDFDAAEHDLGSGAEEGVRAFTEVAQRAIGVSNKVLTRGQRALLADLLREKAEKL